MTTTALAPIVLFVYNRLQHTQETISSLQNNALAKHSDLFVFSDGYKDETGKQKVLDVRAYIASIKGFKSITIVNKEYNQGLSASVIAGVTEVLQRFDRVIVLEDDLVTSTDFLSHMNKALNAYQDHANIYSISGYTFPSPYLKELKDDVFLYPRPASWGWATWKNRWEQADWSMKDFKAFSQDKEAIRKFLRGGEDMYMMLLKQQNGLIQSWAIRWAYTHYKDHAYSVYLKKSKVRSIGTDNSGTNLPQTTKYDTAVHEGDVILLSDLVPQNEWIMRLKDFYRPSFIRRCINAYRFGNTSWLKASKQ
jgi:hypothetical protein